MTKRTRLARASAVALALLMTSGVMAVPANAAPSPDAVQETLAGPYDAWGLREYLRQTQPDTFGGLYGAGDGSLIITATPGNAATVTGARAAFDAKQTGVNARTAPAMHRVAEVANTMRRLESLESAALSAFDTKSAVTMIVVDDRTNSLRIGLDNDTPDTRAAVLKALSASKTEVTFQKQEVVPPVVDRFTDVSPFNAGDRIWNENSLGGCSSGFGVHSASSNTDFLLTAAHCSIIAGQQDFFWNGPSSNPRRTAMGFSQNVSFGSNGWDTQLIRTEASTISWTATNTRSTITNTYVPVVFDQNKVINEGATSVPWQSGLMGIGMSNGCINVGPYNVWGTVRICHLWRADATGSGCAVKGGDSGGPIVSYSGFGPLAIGQTVAGGCGSVYFHAVGDIIAKNPHGISGGLHINRLGDAG
jgi:hypothetical protein